MKAENLINWGELSRGLSGSRMTIRKNRIPDIHKPFIEELLKAVEKVIKSKKISGFGL